MNEPNDRLVEWHMGYAEAIAREIAKKLPRWIAFDDLRQAGFLGLVDASQRFDPQCGAAFTTFAHPRVSGAIWDAVRKMRDIPPALRREAKRQAMFASASEEIGSAIERASSDAAAIDAAMRRAINLAGAVILLSDISDHDQRGTLEPSVSDEESEASRTEVRMALHAAVDALAPRLQTVVRAIAFEGKTQTDLAAERGCNKSVICRLWKEALAELQQSLAGVLGEDASTNSCAHTAARRT